MGELYVVTLLNWTPIFGWHMTRCVVKNGHSKELKVRLD